MSGSGAAGRIRRPARPAIVLVVLAMTLPACASTPAMTPADARAFTRRALLDAGVTNVQVLPEVVPGRYRSPDPRFRDEPAIDVVQTRAVVTGGEVELVVPVRGDSAVFVRDTATNGGRLLSDAQFRALERFRYNPAEERQRDDARRVAAAAAALMAIVGASLFSTVLTGAASGRLRAEAAAPRS